MLWASLALGAVAVAVCAAQADEDTSLLLQYGTRDRFHIPQTEEFRWGWHRKLRRRAKHRKAWHPAGYGGYSTAGRSTTLTSTLTQCGYPILQGRTYDLHIFSFVGNGTTATAERVAGQLAFEPSTHERFAEAVLSGLRTETASFPDRRKLCAWSSQRMLVCTEHHNGSTGSLISANAIASAVAQLAIDAESLNESNFSGLGAVQGDLQQVFGLLDTSGDFTSFLKVSHFGAQSCVPAGFEFSPPGRGSLLRDSSFAARIDVGYAGAAVAGTLDRSEADSKFPSLLGQRFDVSWTLCYRRRDHTVATAIDVVNITGTLMFTEQLNYQNQPDSSGRFALATYSGLVASPAVLTMPSTVSEVCAFPDKRSLVCSRLVEATEGSPIFGSFSSVAVFVNAYAKARTVMESSADQAFENSDEPSDVINQVAEAFASAGFSNASTLARAVAIGTALVGSVKAAADENRRFTELLQLERFDCSGDFTWETCVPWLIRFANPGRGSSWASRAIPRSRASMQWPLAVLCGMALTLSFLKKTLTQQIRSPATAPLMNTPVFLLQRSSALPSHDSAAWRSRKRQASLQTDRLEAEVLGQFNEQGLSDDVGRFVYLELSGGDPASKISLAVCAKASKSSLVCARTSLLNQEAIAEAQVSIAMQVVADADAAAGGPRREHPPPRKQR
ncbi:Naaa [Symbiodinium sp. CCMP2592]|nr:Naaa [Symbiodinium sp. CCMP2592]